MRSRAGTGGCCATDKATLSGDLWLQKINPGSSSLAVHKERTLMAAHIRLKLERRSSSNGMPLRYVRRQR